MTWLAVLGLLGPRGRVSGRIELDGQPLQSLRGDDLAPVRGKRIAMVFQDPAASLNPVHRIGVQLTEALTLHRGLRGHTGSCRGLAPAGPRAHSQPG